MPIAAMVELSGFSPTRDAVQPSTSRSFTRAHGDLLAFAGTRYGVTVKLALCRVNERMGSEYGLKIGQRAAGRRENSATA